MRCALLALALVLASSHASADVIGPGDKQLVCPDGSRRVSLGAGRKSCAPAMCEGDGDCRAEQKECREVPLCIGLTNRAGSSELTEEEVFAGRAPSCPSGSRATTKKVCVATAPVAPPGGSAPGGDASPPPVRASGCGGCTTSGSEVPGSGFAVLFAMVLAARARARRSL